jgi:ABC-type multidrug transport system fused ATPase/permease subunit
MGRVGFRGETRRYAFLLVGARSGAGVDAATLRWRPVCVIFGGFPRQIGPSCSRSVRLCAKNARSVTSGQAGTLLSVLGYMLYTEPLLGLVVLFIAVPQVFAVPLIQRRINSLVRERVVTVRRAGDLVVDNMQGGGGSSASSLASEIGKAFEAIYRVRLRVFKLKFELKVLVSGLQSGGVFLLLFVGGIMVLDGKTEMDEKARIQAEARKLAVERSAITMERVAVELGRIGFANMGFRLPKAAKCRSTLGV